MKRILFRADGNSEIGIGHLIRSIALAQECNRKGWKVRFVTALPDPKLADYLGIQKFDSDFLSISPSEWGTKKDLAMMLLEIREGFDWVVLDNYHFKLDYQKAIRKTGSLLLVIDDYKNRLFDADFILNPNLEAGKLGYEKTSKGAECLLGPSFVPIREELIQRTKRPKKGLKNLLITLGGGAHSMALKKIIEGVGQINEVSFDVKVLLGFSYPEEQVPQRDLGKHRLQIERATLRVDKVYEWTDFAICAGGSTCWELCHYGIAGIVGILSENQETVANSLRDAKIFNSIGWFKDATPKVIADSIRRLIRDPEEMTLRRRRASALVDGRGAERVFEAMLQTQGKKKSIEASTYGN